MEKQSQKCGIGYDFINLFFDKNRRKMNEV